MTVAGWYPDPGGQFEYRYWNGTVWTESVSTGGGTYTQPLPNQTQPTQTSQPMTAADAQAQGFGEMFPTQQPAQGAEPALVDGLAPLFAADIVLMIQTGKKHEFVFMDNDESTVLGYMGLDPTVGRFHKRFNVGDARGRHLVQVTPVGMQLQVDAPEGRIGEIQQTNMLTMQRMRFDVLHAGQTIGQLEGKTWADEAKFTINDPTGQEIGQMSRVKLESDSLRQVLSSKHDRYLLIRVPGIDPTLRTLLTFTPLFIELSRNN